MERRIIAMSSKPVHQRARQRGLRPSMVVPCRAWFRMRISRAAAGLLQLAGRSRGIRVVVARPPAAPAGPDLPHRRLDAQPAIVQRRREQRQAGDARRRPRPRAPRGSRRATRRHADAPRSRRCARPGSAAPPSRQHHRGISSDPAPPRPHRFAVAAQVERQRADALARQPCGQRFEIAPRTREACAPGSPPAPAGRRLVPRRRQRHAVVGPERDPLRGRRSAGRSRPSATPASTAPQLSRLAPDVRLGSESAGRLTPRAPQGSPEPTGRARRTARG